MNRRTLLAVCAGAMVGGCFGIPHRPVARLAWIRLVNERDEAATVEVLVEEGDEQVFSDTYHVGTHPESAVVERDPPVDTPGRYVVRFDADGQLVHVDLLEAVDGDENRVGVEFVFHAEGTLGYRTEVL